jgi:hypothetical protein
VTRNQSSQSHAWQSDSALRAARDGVAGTNATDHWQQARPHLQVAPQGASDVYSEGYASLS